MDFLRVRHVCLRYFNAAGADPEGEIGEWHEPEPHLIPFRLQDRRELQYGKLRDWKNSCLTLIRSGPDNLALIQGHYLEYTRE